ncbi:DUF6328 family protein [Streptomyces sp. LE64]|uniref:DUF6328 family protein n=1 Tax=Streptomyces sp. LE64 TaxID=3448653 RepID=UPI0040417FC6
MSDKSSSKKRSRRREGGNDDSAPRIGSGRSGIAVSPGTIRGAAAGGALAFRKPVKTHWANATNSTRDEPRWQLDEVPPQPDHWSRSWNGNGYGSPTHATAPGNGQLVHPGPANVPAPAAPEPAPITETSTQAYAEILQEVRVAQTALQFLLGFLMAISVTPRFAEFGTSDRAIYVSALVLALASFGLLTAPAPFHRMVTDPRRKRRLVNVSSKLALWGLVLMMLALTCSVLLVLSVVMHITFAAYLSAAILLWMTGFWFCMPLRARLRDRRSS